MALLLIMCYLFFNGFLAVMNHWSQIIMREELDEHAYP